MPARVWAAVATLLAPVLRVSLRRRARAGKEILARLPERRGIDATPRPAGRLIWLHAASVGETVSILPVLAEVARLAPDVTLLVTTGTVTSAEMLAQRLPELGLLERVIHRFAPLDVPSWVARFLDHWRPDAAAFVESELWPNLLAACQARSIPMMLINGRLSARSLAGWQRAPRLAQYLLGRFARIQARSEEDADRFRALGAPQVRTFGDLKLAAAPLPVDQAELLRLRAMLAGRPIWLAASTHPGEEERIFAAHRRINVRHPGLLTIIAPRHPERGAEIAALCAAPRRSLGQSPPGQGVWVADTLGELGLWYRLASVALVGRSLLPPGGGQNPLEPARLGCAVVVGPYTENFAAHIEMLRRRVALVEVADEAALAEAVAGLLDDEPRRRGMAERARLAACQHEDLPERTAAALLALK